MHAVIIVASKREIEVTLMGMMQKLRSQCLHSIALSLGECLESSSEDLLDLSTKPAFASKLTGDAQVYEKI